MRSDIHAFFFKHLYTNRACKAEGCGQPAAEVAAASDIVEAAVFHHCGKIAVRRSGKNAELIIIARAGVCVFDNCAERRAAGDVIDNSRKNFYFVSFFSRG